MIVKAVVEQLVDDIVMMKDLQWVQIVQKVFNFIATYLIKFVFEIINVGYDLKGDI